MKSIQFLVVLMITLFSLTSFAQTYESDGMDPEMDDEMLALDSENPELVLPDSDEMERQEDSIYPEGEDSSWSLGSEDLPAEDYE